MRFVTRRTWLRGAVVAVAFLVTVFVAREVAQAIAWVGAWHPWAGPAVGVALVAAVAWLIVVPGVAYARLAAPLAPPHEVTGPAHDAFVAAYLSACRRNPRLRGVPLESEDDLQRALHTLSDEAEAIAMRTASRIFVATAVSRFGALDAAIVAIEQARMIFEIAHVFQRRPSLRHLAFLYGSVVGTAYLASRTERVDLSEHLRPVLTAAFGRSLGQVPGFTAASGFLTNALFQGSIHAFLTLQVAMLTISWSRATVRPDRVGLHQRALARASHLVVRTAASGTAKVAKAFGVAAAKATGSVAVNVGQSASHAAAAASKAVGDAARQVGSVRPRRRRSPPGDGT